IPESALLAGLVQSPTALNPETNPEAAKKRRDLVLGNMRNEGFITEDEYEEAVATDINLDMNPLPSGCLFAVEGFGYLCDYIQSPVSACWIVAVWKLPLHWTLNYSVPLLKQLRLMFLPMKTKGSGLPWSQCSRIPETLKPWHKTPSIRSKKNVVRQPLTSASITNGAIAAGSKLGPRLSPLLLWHGWVRVIPCAIR